jgi:hypothetical protein
MATITQHGVNTQAVSKLCGCGRNGQLSLCLPSRAQGVGAAVMVA